MNAVREPTRDMPVVGEFDVVICGGGPAGCAAAVAAARRGAKVLLLERLSQVGGMGTSGMVSHWLGGRTHDTTRWVVGGIFRECAEDAAARGIAVIPREGDFRNVQYTPYGQYKGPLLAGIPFDPFLMSPLLEEKLVAAGVDILYGVNVVDVLRSGDRIEAVVGASKEGLVQYRGNCFIDCTADGDIAALAGCPFDKGDATGWMMGASIILQLEGVDEQALMDYIHAEDDPRMRKALARAKAEGTYPFVDHKILVFVKMNRPGAFMLNGIYHGNVDATIAASRTRALLDLRAGIPAIVKFLRRHVPGCSGLTLRAYAHELGTRETRRIRGVYRLTVDDVQSGRTFPDTIAHSAYGWDLSNRDGSQAMHGPKPEVIPIPYCILVPQDVDNVICAGRCISVERELLGPIRVMAPCMATGEAAGAAAAQVVKRGCAFRDVDTAELRSKLKMRNAVVDWVT